jgi:predicted TIM-barrel enzyme
MRNFLQDQKTIIGMIHVGALPGTPRYQGNMAEIIATATAEAKLYREAGIDMLMIENMHDVPFDRHVGPEVTAAMAVVGYEVKKASGLRCGIQILAAANK